MRKQNLVATLSTRAASRPVAAFSGGFGVLGGQHFGATGLTNQEVVAVDFGKAVWAAIAPQILPEGFQ